MIVGFLVPHRCEESALGSCIRCARQYCQTHLSLTASGLLCTACAEGRRSPILAAAALGATDVAAAASAEDSVADEADTFSDLS
jgi:hypothetical protein